jgi:hypothetical protein
MSDILLVDVDQEWLTVAELARIQQKLKSCDFSYGKSKDGPQIENAGFEHAGQYAVGAANAYPKYG